jgi:hypothetical protein
LEVIGKHHQMVHIEGGVLIFPKQHHIKIIATGLTGSQGCPTLWAYRDCFHADSFGEI